jgi:Caspase domain
MVRAGIFIGVDKCGDLRKLNDAAAGAKRMHEWALEQGMHDKTHAKLITDADGQKVQPDQIFDAVYEICGGAGVDQLIVYFAGHGINLQYSDRWLLTEAPVKPYAAVDAKASVERARMCGIPHVVMISDACRVAPEGIQNQNVQGIPIFPNTSGGEKAKPVDEFVACYLGRTATEVKDPALEAANYSALYTDALLDALLGTRPEVLEPGETGDTAKYVKPEGLRDYLAFEIPRRVKALRLEKKVNQNPDALILSQKSWLARIEATAAATRGAGLPPVVPIGAPPPSLRTLSVELTAFASEGRHDDVEQALQEAVATGVPGAAQFVGGLQRIAQPFGPDHFESECGIKVRGARIVDFVAPRVTQCKILGNERNLLRIDMFERPGVSVLLRLDNGTTCVIPVIEGFLAAVTFDQDELVDVAYEPSANTWRWNLYKQRAPEVRALRAVAATASRHGRFRLDLGEAATVGKQMQYAKGIDPTLAVYSAYAYNDLQLIDRVQHMSALLSGDVGLTFFDLELIGRRLVGKSIDYTSQRVVPFLPLLSQGWSLLRAHRVKLHPDLDDIEQSLRNSLWTQFDERGIQKLERAMLSTDVL